MVQGIEDYSLWNISNRINLRRGQTSMYFLGKAVFRFLPRVKRSCFWEKNIVFPDNTRKIMRLRSTLWKDHIFRRSEENIKFPCIFYERSFFIFRSTCKIIFSGKRNIILTDNTRKIIFHPNFFGKTIFSGRPEKGNMVFRAVFTNFPLQETIDIAINLIFNHNHNLNITEKNLKIFSFSLHLRLILFLTASFIIKSME